MKLLDRGNTGMNCLLKLKLLSNPNSLGGDRAKLRVKSRAVGGNEAPENQPFCIALKKRPVDDDCQWLLLFMSFPENIII